MERSAPVRKPHTCTSDLLTWSEAPPPGDSSSVDDVSRLAVRSSQPSNGMDKVLFGGQISDEEAESLNKRKPCSGYKLKEMTGSRIFSADGGDESTKPGNFENRTSVRIVQQAANGISQISFGSEERVSPRKATSLTEVAKQRELSGTQESDSDSRTQKYHSDAKSKELSGSDIFGPPPEVPPRSSAAVRTMEAKDMDEPAPRSLRTSVRVSNPAGGQSNIVFGDKPIENTAKKIHGQKFAEMVGNDIFKGDMPQGSAEKPMSVAKLKEMSGNDIFADGKVESRDYFGGVRKPPGGESSIALI